MDVTFIRNLGIGPPGAPWPQYATALLTVTFDDGGGPVLADNIEIIDVIPEDEPPFLYSLVLDCDIPAGVGPGITNVVVTWDQQITDPFPYQIPHLIGASLPGQSNLDATLDISRYFTAGLRGQCNLDSVLLRTHQISATLPGQVNLESALFVSRTMAAVLNGAVTLESQLEEIIVKQMAAVLNGEVTLESALSVINREFTARLTGEVQFDVDAIRNHQIAGLLQGQTNLDVNLIFSGTQQFAAALRGQINLESLLNAVVQKPVIEPIPDQPVRIYQEWSYQAVATDPQGLTLTWSLSGEPAGMVIDTQTGLMTWSVDIRSGNFTVTVIADNGAESDTELFQALVSDWGFMERELVQGGWGERAITQDGWSEREIRD